MSTILWIGLGFAVASGFAEFLGGLLAVGLGDFGHRRMRQIIAAGAGFLLAAAFLDLIPEVAQARPAALAFVLVGYLAIYVAENFFSHHAHEVGPDCEGEDCGNPTHGHEHEHRLVEEMHPEEEPLVTRSASLAAAVGLGLHAFFDGVAIMSAFEAGLASGILLFAAITLHKLPTGFSLASVMRAAKFRDRIALGTTGILVITTSLGALVAALIGSFNPSWREALIALAAGSLVYIGATDMIPMTQSHENKSGIGYALGGSAVFFATLQLLHAVGLG